LVEVGGAGTLVAVATCAYGGQINNGVLSGGSGEISTASILMNEMSDYRGYMWSSWGIFLSQ